MKNTGAAFMRETYYDRVSESDQQQQVPQPPLEVPQEGERIALPAPEELAIPALDLRQAIAQRQSVRSYSGEPLTMDELSYLLWATQGVKKLVERPHVKVTFRTVPSAGARHAFDTYVLANRVDGLEPGLYRYMAVEHALVRLPRPETVAEDLTQACYGQKFVGTSAVTFFWAADVYRMAWRYVERGYRYLHLDAGHVCQNFYLASEQIGGGACGIAAFNDEELNAQLELDGEKRFVVYLAPMGKKEA